MDVTDIKPYLDQLDGDIDKLEEVLGPLISNLNDVASKLPLLDKAKLYVLMTYSIENALFSALRLQGIDAKQHPVFTELARVRQYFQKIKKLEEPPAERTQAVDTQAAIRFIKADLADNQDINIKLKEQLAKERAKAAIRAAKGKGQKRSADESAGESSKIEAQDEGAAEAGDKEEGEEQAPPNKKTKKSKSGSKGKNDNGIRRPRRKAEPSWTS